MPLAKRKRDVGIARRLPQLLHEQLNAFCVNGCACGELLKILRGKRHACIDVEGTFEACGGFMRQAVPGKHHAAVVLRAGVPMWNAARNGTQAIRFTDRHNGY